MDCNKANKLMMKFMDNSLTEEEHLLLESHLQECEECKKDFSLYTEILEDFSEEIGLIEAPESFEENVMSIIEDIEPEYVEVKNRMNKFYYLTGGAIVLLFTSSLVVNMNKELILTNFDEKSFLYKILELNEYISISSKSVLDFLTKTFYIIESNLPIFINYLRLASFIAIIVLVLAQYRVYKNNKVEA